MHRKSPAQLDREIAEVLSRTPGSSRQQPFYGLRVVASEKAGYAPGKHVVQYKDRNGMWFDIGDPKSKAAADAALDAERSRVVTLARGGRSHAKTRNVAAVADALGYIPEGAVVRRAEETYSHYSTNELRREIQSLEDEFEMSGGRGIGLADRLDAARTALALRGSTKARGRSHATIGSGGSIGTVNEFWDLYEAELVKSILEAPEKYALRAGESAGDYGRRIRTRFQATAESSGLGQINLDSNTFKRVARRLGIAKFSQKALKTAYLGLAR